jgi:hypothetical protein
MHRTTEPRPTSCPAEMILPDYEGDQPQDEGPEETNSRRTLVRRGATGCVAACHAYLESNREGVWLSRRAI